MFDLTRADGIAVAQQQLVTRCRVEFETLAREMLARLGIALNA
jgi:hypothetical protein